MAAFMPNDRAWQLTIGCVEPAPLYWDATVISPTSPVTEPFWCASAYLINCNI
jgi:hypothetical protein